MANAASGALASLLLLSTIAAAVLQGTISPFASVFFLLLPFVFCGFSKHDLRATNKQRGRETARAHINTASDAPYGLS